MLGRANEFDRYFFHGPAAASGGVFSGFGFGFSRFSYAGASRDEVSEIVPGLVFLSNLPKSTPFQSLIAQDGNANAALVMSCLDIAELAQSGLLLEPGNPRVKFHVLAMEDVTARVGATDQVKDALALMSTFADAKKPIHIHCFSGVGRSAMMTALHIAHRYLLGDPEIMLLIDAKGTLNPESEDFISNLYSAVSSYVYSKRTCVQYDNKQRNDFAISVLTEIHKNLKLAKPSIAQRDERDYSFLAEFVQTPEYKRLQHHFYKRASYPERDVIKSFMHAFLNNQEGWYQQLQDAINNIQNGENPFYQFCHPESRTGEDEAKLLSGLHEAIQRVSAHWPEAQFSLQSARPRPGVSVAVVEPQAQLVGGLKI